MKNKFLLVLFSILTIAAVVLTGCSGASPTSTGTTSAAPPANSTVSGATSSAANQPGSTTGSSSNVAGAGSVGHLEVRVTDAPPRAEVTSIMVTIASVEVHTGDNNSVSRNSTAPSANTTKSEPQDQDRGKGNNKPDKPTATTTTGAVSSNASDNGDSGWVTLKLSGPTTFDLLALKAMAANGGLTQLLGGIDLPAGTYTQIRLEVQSISVALGNGPSQPATVPSGKIKFVQPFKIVAGQTTGLVFDFDAAQSVNITGNDKVMFKPVIKLSIAKQPGTN
jgi:hypothetical protein